MADMSSQHAALAATVDADPRPETLAQARSALQTLHQQLRNALAAGQQHHGDDNNDDSTTEQLVIDAHDALAHWLAPAQRASTATELPSKPLPLALWLQCMEVCSCLLLTQSQQSDDSSAAPTSAVARVHALLVAARPPLELPSAAAHCAASQQIAFGCSVWNALVGNTLALLSSGASASPEPRRQQRYERVLSLLLDAYAHWMSAAMRGFGVAFLAATSAALHAHISTQQQRLGQDRDQRIARNVWSACHSALLTKLDDAAAAAAPQWRASAPAVAIALLVLDAVDSDVSGRDTALRIRTRVLAQLQNRIVSKLRVDPFPHVHDPDSVVAVALSLSSLHDESGPVDASAVLVQLFALLRRVNLPLLSLRLREQPEHEQPHQALAAEALRLAQRLAQAVCDSARGTETAAMVFRMLEASVDEATQQFRSTPAAYASLLRALVSVYAPGLLTEDALSVLPDSTDCDAASGKNDTHATLQYLQTLYSSASALLRALTDSPPFVRDTSAALRAFVLLSRLEFARESCASAETNALMRALTQRVEDAVEQPSEQHRVLAALLQSVPVVSGSSALGASDAWQPASQSSSTAPVATRTTVTTATRESAIPLDTDVIFGAQALAVGVIVQRKLRVVLFREPALVDDALALVFRGVLSGYAPLSAFAQSFLAFCLTHLGHYVSVYRIAPYYLQLTLSAYPQSSSARQALAKTCGVIFGALFFASADATGTDATASASGSGSSSAGGDGVLSPQQRMAVWAVQQCCVRVQDLVLAPVAVASFEASAGVPTSPATDSSSTTDTGGNAPLDSSAEGPLASGLMLAGVVFEVMKMSPLELLAPIAVEVERLVSACAAHARTARSEHAIAAVAALLRQLFTSISQHCEAPKRAWLAAWYVELTQLYALDSVTPASSRSPHSGADGVQSRL